MAVTIYGSFYLKGEHLAHEKEEVEKNYQEFITEKRNSLSEMMKNKKENFLILET